MLERGKEGARGVICIYHFVALLLNEEELFTGPSFLSPLREVFNIPIYSATYWDNWPIERERERSPSAVVASDKLEKTRSRINGDSGMEPRENSDLPMKSPVLPLLKFDAIRSLLLKKEPFKEGVKVQMRPGSPFMCRVNPLGRWGGLSVGHVLVLSLRSSPMRAVSAMRRGKRGRKKASVGDKLIMEGARASS